MMPDTDILPKLSRTERAVLKKIWGRADVTQKLIVETSDLPQQTVSRILVSMLETGIVKMGNKVGEPKPGKPTRALRLVPEIAYGQGIAVLADMVSFVVTNMDGEVVSESFLQQRAPTPDVVSAWVMQEFNRLSASRPDIMSRLIGTGVALSGSFIDGRTFNTPPSLESWAGVDLQTWAEDLFSLPAIAENDGTAAALAEARLGLGRGLESFAYLYLSEGAGGGVILDGKAWRGRHGNAGEFAAGLHAPIYPFPNLDLLRHLLAHDGYVFSTVIEMVHAFDPSWRANREWALRVKDSLSVIISNAMGILDVDAVVLGGQIPSSLVDEVRPYIEVFDQRRRGVLRPRGAILAAEIKKNAAAIGASTLPIRAYLGL